MYFLNVFECTSKLTFLTSSPGLSGLSDDQIKQLIQTSSTSGQPICGICLKEFSQRQSVFDHLKSHHGGKASHQCMYCSLFFKTLHCRTKHISKKHREAHRMSKLMEKVVWSFRVFHSPCLILFVVQLYALLWENMFLQFLLFYTLRIS